MRLTRKGLAAYMSNELAGKVTVITGGASGLGEGLARRFAAEGAKVMIGDVDAVRGKALAEELGRATPGFSSPMSATSSRSGAW